MLVENILLFYILMSKKKCNGALCTIQQKKKKCNMNIKLIWFYVKIAGTKKKCVIITK